MILMAAFKNVGAETRLAVGGPEGVTESRRLVVIVGDRLWKSSPASTPCSNTAVGPEQGGGATVAAVGVDAPPDRVKTDGALRRTQPAPRVRPLKPGHGAAAPASTWVGEPIRSVGGRFGRRRASVSLDSTSPLRAMISPGLTPGKAGSGGFGLAWRRDVSTDAAEHRSREVARMVAVFGRFVAERAARIAIRDDRADRSAAAELWFRQEDDWDREYWRDLAIQERMVIPRRAVVAFGDDRETLVGCDHMLGQSSGGRRKVLGRQPRRPG